LVNWALDIRNYNIYTANYYRSYMSINGKYNNDNYDTDTANEMIEELVYEVE